MPQTHTSQYNDMLWNLLFAQTLLATSAVAVSSIGDPFDITGTHQTVLNGFPVQNAFALEELAGHTAGIVLSSTSVSTRLVVVSPEIYAERHDL